MVEGSLFSPAQQDHQFEVEDFGIEVKLRLKHPLDILGLAKTVLLAFQNR